MTAEKHLQRSTLCVGAAELSADIIQLSSERVDGLLQAASPTCRRVNAVPTLRHELLQPLDLPAQHSHHHLSAE